MEETVTLKLETYDNLKNDMRNLLNELDDLRNEYLELKALESKYTNLLKIVIVEKPDDYADKIYSFHIKGSGAIAELVNGDEDIKQDFISVLGGEKNE